eukprot:scaffold140967_cov47-Attheya_sp.AAC.1
MIYVYPLIEEEMSDAEKSYAYMTNTAAISSADIHPKVKLQAFGNATDCMPLVNVMSTTFITHQVSCRAYLCRTGSVASGTIGY